MKQHHAAAVLTAGLLVLLLIACSQRRGPGAPFPANAPAPADASGATPLAPVGSDHPLMTAPPGLPAQPDITAQTTSAAPAAQAPAQSHFVGLPGCPPNGAVTQAGLGDPIFPQLGNGGFDVQHYALDLSADMVARTISGTATLDVQALQDLPAFNLDLRGLSVRSIAVDGRSAGYARAGAELTITPTVALLAGRTFSVTIAYGGQPAPVRDPGGPIPTGWLFDGEGAFVASEPAGANTWYPVNDHPCDKATYTLAISVPQPYVVAANGLLVGQTEGNGTVTFTYQARDPIASYLVTVAVAKFVTQTQSGPNALPIRNFFPPELAERAEAGFRRTPEMIDFFSSRFGPYPFEAYGVVVATSGGSFALETQTLTLFGRDFVRSPEETESVAVHELAHQWFGDSVSLASWQDIWLNEGFASYGADLWLEHVDGAQALDAAIRKTYATVVERNFPPPARPPATDLFNGGVYNRGALALHALRLRVGDNVFFDILRTYTARFRYANATTGDFVRIAEEVSRQDLGPFFRDWLENRDLPPIPEMNLFAQAPPTPSH